MKGNFFKFAIFVFGIFIFALFLLFTLGLVPEIFRSQSPEFGFSVRDVERNTGRSTVGEMPDRIVINKIGVDTPILNPLSTDINVLDNELRKGAVRYPGSGLLGDGHMFLFGHSTGLPVVRNPAYKAFSGLGNLDVGDEIIIYSNQKKYVYKVFSVRLTTADEAYVDFSVNKNMLTLSTCDTFGQKQDRFVVEADFVGVR